MNIFANKLREHNLKATPQRLVILESIHLHGHLNIDRLYDEVKQKFNTVSLATIYKNINAMIQNMVLSEVKLPSEKSVYEITKDAHAHLVCTQCKKIFDISIATDNITQNVSNQYQFEIEKSDFVFLGKCKSCK